MRLIDQSGLLRLFHRRVYSLCSYIRSGMSLRAILHETRMQNRVQYLPPSFFIIGERKCATSSLYRYLIDHPQVLPCRIKEPQFFSKPFWYRVLFFSRYRALFPETNAAEMKMQWLDLDEKGSIVKEELLMRRDPLEKIITGEASANTFAQVPPKRLKRAYPNAKLILCLRHPVDRAYSHYRMLQRFVQEGRRNPIQLTDYVSDFMDDLVRVDSGEQGYFAGLSFYTERLKRWSQVFGKESIYIVRTEDLLEQTNTQRILNELCRFLALRDYDFSEVLQLMINKDGDRTLDPQLQKELFVYFKEDVYALEEFTGRSFNWNP